MPGCSSWGCSNRASKEIKLHRFPRNPERRRIWELKLRWKNWKSKNNSFVIVCQDHFDDSQYEQGRADGIKKLKPNAIPTIFKFKPTHKSRKSPEQRTNSPDDRCSFLKERTVFEHSYCHQESGSPISVSNNETPNLDVDTDPSFSADKTELHDGAFNPDLKMMEDKLREMEDRVTQLKQALARERREKNKLIKEKEECEEQIPKVFNPDQLRMLCKESRRGTKWSSITVKKALQLRFACGATGYQLLLEQHQPLPSMRTLRRKMEVVTMEPGILEEVFNFMKFKVDTMKSKERVCSLTLDEMSLKAGLQYDVGFSCFRGDVTLPQHEGVATHALVFMLGGITTRWKQTVAYHFTGNSINGDVLKPIVITLIRKAKEIGLHVISVTSDMGSSNRAMWRSFGIISSKHCQLVNKIPHPCEPGRVLYFMADVPHIIKNLKAALVNGNHLTLSKDTVKKFKLGSNTVSVAPVKELASFQKDNDLKLAPRLSESSIKPSHFQKMKVSQALQFFSHSVSSGLQYLVENEGYDSSFLTTAWFLDFCNRLFDLMSSRHPVMALSKINEDAYGSAISHLKSAISVFQKIVIGSQGYWKPVQTGVVLTTTSMLEVQDELLGNGYSFILTSRFTQDCLENLFGCVRMKNPVPTALEFRQALKIITVAQFLKAPSTGSYQEDDGEYLAEFLSQTPPASPAGKETFAELRVDSDFSSEPSLKDAEMQSLYHLAGYCIHQVRKRDKHCSTCLEKIENKHAVSSAYSKLTKLKEYKEGCLAHCTDLCFHILHQAELMFRSCENRFGKRSGLMTSLVNNAERLTNHLTIPSCHNIKAKLLSHYFSVRLHIYAKKQKDLRCDAIEKSKSGGEMGSKSMAMRKIVKNLK